MSLEINRRPAALRANTFHYRAEPKVDLANRVVLIDEFESGPHIGPADLFSEALERHTRMVLDTRETVIREALVKLGWTPPPSSKAPPRAARTAGANAGDACLAKAERVAGFDASGARAFMVGYLETWDQASSENLVAAAKLAGFKPHDDRAFGPVIAGMAKRGEIHQVGTCSRARGNGTSGGRVWALSHARS